MKKMSLIIGLILILIVTVPVFAVDEDYHFGIQMLQESISKADGISGGSYLSLGAAFSFNPKFTINVKYAWNTAPESFSDHLISLEPQYTFGKPGSPLNSNLSLVYLKNMDQTDSAYYGLRWCPISSGRYTFTQNAKMTIELFPVGYLYNADTRRYVRTFEFVSFTTYF
jgi:hypothetical protein